MGLDPGLIGFIAGAGPQIVDQFTGPQEARIAGQKENQRRAIEYANQKEFAQMGIRWKVQDAIAAGLHPLAALGGQTASYSPVSIGGEKPSTRPDYAAMSDMGANLGRSMAASQAPSERTTMFQDAQIQGQQLDNEGKALQNELLRSQLTRQNSGQLGPGLPPSTSGVRGQEKTGAIPSTGWAETATGLETVPSKDIKERIEDSPMEWTWMLKNGLLNNLGKGSYPPKSMLPKGYDEWEWNHARQEYMPVKASWWTRNRGRIGFGPNRK